MFITNKDFKVLTEIDFYLAQLDGEIAKQLEVELDKIIERLEIKRIVKNSVNSRVIAERRKTDKNYARSKKENTDTTAFLMRSGVI